MLAPGCRLELPKAAPPAEETAGKELNGAAEDWVTVMPPNTADPPVEVFEEAMAKPLNVLETG